MGRPAAAADVFAAVADPTRRAILDRLRGGPVPAGEIAAGFDISRPAVSKHLRVLREAELVQERKEGRHRYYELTPGPIRDVADWAEAYRAFWSANLLALKEHVEKRQKQKEDDK
jgi:DNA-binding transcriptional ArsR family regulator